MSESGLIYKKIPAVMKDMGAVEKDRKNDKQGYKFRGIDDVYNAYNQVLAKHEIFTVPRVTNVLREEHASNSGGRLAYSILTMEFDFFATDGSKVTACVVGEGMDSGDKASNKAMAVAHKYAIIQTFCTPTEEPKDPEVDSHEPAPRKKPAVDPGEHVIGWGNKLKGSPIKKVEPHTLQEALEWLNSPEGVEVKKTRPAQEFIFYAQAYLQQKGIV